MKKITQLTKVKQNKRKHTKNIMQPENIKRQNEAQSGCMNWFC